jgi:hypothetical protein
MAVNWSKRESDHHSSEDYDNQNYFAHVGFIEEANDNEMNSSFSAQFQIEEQVFEGNVPVFNPPDEKMMPMMNLS